MSTDLAIIRAALAAATEGKALVEHAPSQHTMPPEWDRAIYAVRDMHAAAPAWLAELCDRVEAAEAERDRLSDLAGFLAGAQAGFEAAAHSLGGPEVVLAGAGRAQNGPAASEPVLVPPRQAEAHSVDRHVHQWGGDADSNALCLMCGAERHPQCGPCGCHECDRCIPTIASRPTWACSCSANNHARRTA